MITPISGLWGVIIVFSTSPAADTLVRILITSKMDSDRGIFSPWLSRGGFVMKGGGGGFRIIDEGGVWVVKLECTLIIIQDPAAHAGGGRGGLTCIPLVILSKLWWVSPVASSLKILSLVRRWSFAVHKAVAKFFSADLLVLRCSRDCCSQTILAPFLAVAKWYRYGAWVQPQDVGCYGYPIVWTDLYLNVDIYVANDLTLLIRAKNSKVYDGL